MSERVKRDIAHPAYRSLEAMRPDDGPFVAVLAIFFAWFITIW